MTLRRRDWVHHLLTAASVLLIGVAGVVLYRLLHDLDLVDVGAALRDVRWTGVACAGLLIACAYATLTLYDYFALRTLGYRIAYRHAAMAGFTSYAIGHNVGATTIAAAAIRYRVYADHGLDALAVAKVCLIAGMTFWLGNAAVLGVGILANPEAASAINQLPEDLNRVAGAATLAALALYVLWVGPRGRRVGMREIEIRLPGRGSTLLQIGIGVADLALCATAMYVLVPQTSVPFAHLAVVFVCAMLLGFASHAPGGIGVFDAAMLLGLTDVAMPTLVASLIVFRVLYYFVPLALAIALLVAREMVMAARRMSQSA